MPLLELPHTSGCLVCGPGNAKGLRLRLFVDPQTGIVQTRYVTAPEHIGFQGVTHGGAIATVMDEVMVWAATWAAKRFCLCGEMTVRFRRPAEVDKVLNCTGRVESARSKLISTTGEVTDEAGVVLATTIGKYVPMGEAENRQYMGTLLEDPETATAAGVLRGR